MIKESIELIARARDYDKRLAIIDEGGEVTYKQLLEASRGCASRLLGKRVDLEEQRVALLVPPGREYVVGQWGTWLAGGMSVPLCLTHPKPELLYVLNDADVTILVADRRFEAEAKALAAEGGVALIWTDDLTPLSVGRLPALPPARRAMIVYTSGTTGKPKGVVSTHENIQAQIISLTEAWGWSHNDRILHVLPLHHLHGILNVLACALWSGAACELMPRFDAREVWNRFEAGGLTLFMAVPSIYQRLIKTWEEGSPDERQKWSASCSALRLMVSGSAALPVPVLERWRNISGHTLLERYGMTEIGMALSNPLEGARIPGSVGTPLPGVEVRLVDESGEQSSPGTPGELEVRGLNVFKEYWRRPQETEKAFHESWFRTGDIVAEEGGIYRILGRQSVDIIKTGGYKVSALEIEQELLSHPGIEECAVVGTPDEEWGERVCAAIKWRDGMEEPLDALRAWCKQRLAIYKIPSKCLAVDALPRNAMGKVTKGELVKLFQI